VIRRQSVVVFVLLILPISLFSQSRIPGQARNTASTVEIQLTIGNSRPLLNTPVYVELSSFQGGSKRGYTDSDGRVNFYVMSGTEYTANISGPGIEGTSASFAIGPGERYHRQEIEVVVVHNGTAEKAPGGLVAASNLRVPENARQEFAKGMKEMTAENWSKARQHFEKAVKAYPQFDWGYNNIGVTYIHENNTKAARDAFEKAVAINDKNVDAVRNLARMKLIDKDYSGGKELLLKIGPNPGDFEALMMLAYAQLNTHEFDAALANALKVQQGEPDRFPFAHLVAARAYEIKGNQSAAQAQYQMYLQKAPNTPDAQLAKEGMQRVAASK
jgi:Tfp pilus assembly protein PilF